MRIPRIPLCVKVLFTAVLLVLLTRTFAFTSCDIPFTGMENTLYQGEKVLVNKWSYGLRLPFTASHFLPEQARKGDIVLFNNPNPADKETPVYAREVFISRCAGTPGDTLMLNNQLLPVRGQILSPDAKTIYAYPYEMEDTLLQVMDQLGIQGSQLVGYSEGKYMRSFSHYEYYLLRQRLDEGADFAPVKEDEDEKIHPFVIPSKGKKVTVYPWNITLLCNTIVQHEHRCAAVKNDTLYVEGKPVTSYVFRKDYYWMSSNNPVNLSDSRLFGLVPHDHLVGRAFCIWFSPRTDRIFQRVQ